MLRKPFVLVFIRFRVRARHHEGLVFKIAVVDMLDEEEVTQKYKKFKKKLALSKKTIANLNTMEMTLLHGGNFYPDPITQSCPYCFKPIETILISECNSYCGNTCSC